MKKLEDIPYGEYTNNDTGEIVKVASYTTPEGKLSEERKKNGFKKKQDRNDIQEGYENYTGDKFSWFNTEKVSEVSAGVTEDKFRAFGAIMILSTYLSFEDNKLPMKNLKEISDTLGLGLRQTKEVIAMAINMGLIKRLNGRYYLNQDLVFRGKLQKNEIVIRAYHEGIRALQSMSLANVGFLFMIMPHISFDHWIICKNPEKDDYETIQAMNMTELAEITGFDRSTLTKKFSKMTFDYNGKKMSTVLYVGNPVSKRMTIIVNPMLFGRKVSENYKSIAQLFDINI